LIKTACENELQAWLKTESISGLTGVGSAVGLWIVQHKQLVRMVDQLGQIKMFASIRLTGVGATVGVCSSQAKQLVRTVDRNW
jgi:hypothetical protein